MSNTVLILITSLFLSLLAIIITIVIVKKNRSNKYKKEINELDIEKNSLVGVPILSELSKVRELVKTDNLKKKLDNWDTSFKLIRDDKLSKVNDMISEADFLVEKNDYRNAIKKISKIEMEINSLKKQADSLMQEIKIITTSEERNRSLITKLKIVYREIKNKYERTIKDYGEIGEFIEKEFVNIDKKFNLFEEAIDNNDYVLVEKVIIDLEEDINKMKKFIDEVPSLILMATALVPSKIEEISTLYFRMIRDGFPLDYLNFDYNIKEIKDKVAKIIERLKDLDMGDAGVELKTILDYFNSLYNDFDKEKNCKDLFRENSKRFSKKIYGINKVVRDIYLQIDDIKATYDLSEKDINKFSMLNKTLEQLNDDFKTLQEHSKGKTFAYSILVEELDGLSTKLSRLQDDLDFQLRSITSMKDDEYRAKEQLDNIQKLLKESKNKLKDYKIPVIPNSYFIELKEAQEAIREIIKELNKKPIVIKILNIRVDTARDLVFKIYNKTNDMIKSVMISEKVIIYGNRYRSKYPEIDKGLEKATTLFNKGQYRQSLELSLQVLSEVDNDVLSKIKL